MEEIYDLNTTMQIIDNPESKNGPQLYSLSYYEEKYMDTMNLLEKEGLPSTREFIVKRIISELPTEFPDYNYVRHEIYSENGIKITFIFTQV